MKNIIRIFCRIFWNFYPSVLTDKFNSFLNLIYSEKTRVKLGGLGQNPTILRPIRLLGGKNVFIGDNFYCYWGVRIETYSKHNGTQFHPSISIGNGVSINPDCHLAAINGIELHDGVMLASRVFITDHYHGTISQEAIEVPPGERILFSKGKVIIKRNAWVGEGVCVMPGITIGENTIIGANSVVTHDIPDNAVAAGVPAKVIKQLEL